MKVQCYCNAICLQAKMYMAELWQLKHMLQTITVLLQRLSMWLPKWPKCKALFEDSSGPRKSWACCGYLHKGKSLRSWRQRSRIIVFLPKTSHCVLPALTCDTLEIPLEAVIVCHPGIECRHWKTLSPKMVSNMSNQPEQEAHSPDPGLQMPQLTAIMKMGKS